MIDEHENGRDKCVKLVTRSVTSGIMYLEILR